MRPVRAWLCLWLLVASSTCLAASTVPPPKLTVFAAASLKESMDATAAAWRARTGQDVVVSYAASSALAQQIDHGAEADVFVSADSDWMDDLVGKRLVDTATRVDIARNRLVLVAPAGSTVARVSLRDRGAFLAALGDGRLAVAETTSVPAGRYARQALAALGLWDAVAPRLAPADNVRAALVFVATGDAPLGIVYATDARAEPKVKVVATFPATAHAPIVYPAARVAASRNAGAAGFVAFLRGRKAQEIFRRAGFLPAR